MNDFDFVNWIEELAEKYENGTTPVSTKEFELELSIERREL